jgi:hypothetical protein
MMPWERTCPCYRFYSSPFPSTVKPVFSANGVPHLPPEGAVMMPTFFWKAPSSIAPGESTVERQHAQMRKKLEEIVKQYDAETRKLARQDLQESAEQEQTPVQQTPLPFSLDPVVVSFVDFKPGDGSLAATMCDVAKLICTHAQDRNSGIVDEAKVMMNTFSGTAQLPGWQHVQHYIIDPPAYVAAKGIHCSYESDNIAPLLEQGRKLQERLCTQVQRLVAPEKAATAIVYSLAADRKWIADAQKFIKEAELRVTQMLTRNATRFAQFRELQKQGVAWPHGVLPRGDIEKAGFSFRPMMIKRDRCVCDTCLVEVSGWRPWDNPWLFHDYNRHPPEFRPAWIPMPAAANGAQKKSG